MAMIEKEIKNFTGPRKVPDNYGRMIEGSSPLQEIVCSVMSDIVGARTKEILNEMGYGKSCEFGRLEVCDAIKKIAVETAPAVWARMMEPMMQSVINSMRGTLPQY